MKNLTRIALICGLTFLPNLSAQGPPLKLAGTISMPGVAGRIDHLSVDVKGRRLFVSALGNNTVEVLDLASGKDIQSIANMHEPQGVFYVPESNKIFVANGDDGVVRVLDGSSYKQLSTVQLSSDADDIRYDAAKKLIFVGYGSGGGGIGVLDAMTGSELGTIKLRGHAEAFEVENGGARIYVNVPEAREIAVADWDRRSVVERWPMGKYGDNFPMAFDRAQPPALCGLPQARRTPGARFAFGQGGGAPGGGGRCRRRLLRSKRGGGYTFPAGRAPSAWWTRWTPTITG